MSLPLRERGLKCTGTIIPARRPGVAPLAGAWIEILNVGTDTMAQITSLPLRERGLKLQICRHQLDHDIVAPLAGAWIEI